MTTTIEFEGKQATYTFPIGVTSLSWQGERINPCVPALSMLIVKLLVAPAISIEVGVDVDLNVDASAFKAHRRKFARGF